MKQKLSKMKKIIRNFFGSNDGVHQRDTIATLCIIIGMLVISVSCKKEGLKNQAQNNYNEVSSIESTISYNDDILKHSISIEEQFKISPFIRLHVCLKEYVLFSVDDSRENIRFGYITEKNEELFNMLSSYFSVNQEKINSTKNLGEDYHYFYTTDFDTLVDWVKEELDNNRDVAITFDQNSGIYTGISWPKEET